MTNITAICDAIIAEAERVKKYSETTESMLLMGNGEESELFDEIRMDGVNNITKLAVALTAIFYEAPLKEGNDEIAEI